MWIRPFKVEKSTVAIYPSFSKIFWGGSHGISLQGFEVGCCPTFMRLFWHTELGTFAMYPARQQLRGQRETLQFRKCWGALRYFSWHPRSYQSKDTPSATIQHTACCFSPHRYRLNCSLRHRLIMPLQTHESLPSTHSSFSMGYHTALVSSLLATA